MNSKIYSLAILALAMTFANACGDSAFRGKPDSKQGGEDGEGEKPSCILSSSAFSVDSGGSVDITLNSKDKLTGISISGNGVTSDTNTLKSGPITKKVTFTATAKKDKKTIECAPVTVKVNAPGHIQCSEKYVVPGSANPYLAGMPNGTSISYPDRDLYSVDVAPAQSPVPQTVKDVCLKSGSRLYFVVGGSTSHGGGAQASGPDGDLARVTQHVHGAKFGKSNIKAPYNSLIGVFLADGNPELNTAPAMLDFSSPSSRDQLELSPQIGQIFFIGDGLNSLGAFQKFVVPTGAKKFYFGIMDSFEWNNNDGNLTGEMHLED